MPAFNMLKKFNCNSGPKPTLVLLMITCGQPCLETKNGGCTSACASGLARLLVTSVKPIQANTRIYVQHVLGTRKFTPCLFRDVEYKLLIEIRSVHKTKQMY